MFQLKLFMFLILTKTTVNIYIHSIRVTCLKEPLGCFVVWFIVDVMTVGTQSTVRRRRDIISGGRRYFGIVRSKCHLPVRAFAQMVEFTVIHRLVCRCKINFIHLSGSLPLPLAYMTW
ncbi:hypothetical protein I3843_05G063500 [Carya illinoinensis]|uniref:Uncharacterized protein n=1 Tax=Carya illinoinensis TaxID=32201 RepID=A0A922JKE0_CARIL|nr:hypothetical protein I3760_05G071500 [Carya illinoinensis]KAG6711756.1 hypothetical protein I3842_05G070200 [Carya illinoinensis]KAG7978054.1 hypothetical protein I3843_05G063500 [Carya illinoinensis]